MKKLSWLAISIVLLAAVVVVGYVLVSSLNTAVDGEPTVVAVETSTAGTVPATVEDVPVTPSGATAAAGDGHVPPAATATIILLHTNDFHGAIEPEVSSSGEKEFGGLVNLVSLIDQLRAEDPEHTLLLDAGDSFQGTFLSNSTYGQVVMAAMNVADYDAWTLGNHEFDWGQDVVRARIAEAEFPALAANVLDAKTGEVWAAVQPYTIVNVGQARVAILGLSYPDTPGISRPQNVAGLEFEGAVETVRRYLPELEAQADLIVVLSHAGYDNDVALARTVDGIDVIVGGHSHKFIEQPIVVNDTIIVQAGAKGQVLGRLELTLDLATGEVIDYVRRDVLRDVSNEVSEVNPRVKALVDAALVEAAETIEQPVGETVRALKRGYAGEFALGNLVVDAMLASDLDGQANDIATHNNGGIRADLPKGPINYGQIYAVLPFDNQLMAMDLTGEQVLQILEHSVADEAGNLQVAGLSFRFSMANPKGQRVLDVIVGGEPLELERVYRMVTIDSLASGGDGYDTFTQGTNLAYGDPAVWVLAEYIRAHSPVDPQVEGRIVQR
jgi:5'-nucleotidase/UDP-sugar diphosphatase